MSPGIACYTGCSNPVIGQCPGYGKPCGVFYCKSHSRTLDRIGIRCGSCAAVDMAIRFQQQNSDYRYREMEQEERRRREEKGREEIEWVRKGGGFSSTGRRTYQGCEVQVSEDGRDYVSVPVCEGRCDAGEQPWYNTRGSCACGGYKTKYI
jgi:hypothetical protein